MKQLAALPLVLLACATTSPTLEQVVEPGMVAFDARYTPGISPSIEVRSGSTDTGLVYRLTEDGRGLTTRVLGAPHAPFVRLTMRTDVGEVWHRLVATVPRSGYHRTLAVWRLDAEGRLADAHVLTEPFLEWRALPMEPGQVYASVEWRPLVDGAGVGEWRR